MCEKREKEKWVSRNTLIERKRSGMQKYINREKEKWVRRNILLERKRSGYEEKY